MSVVAMMADDLAVSAIRLDCPISCALTLIAAGWRGRVVGDNLDAVMAAAQNMARSGDAPPGESGVLPKDLTRGGTTPQFDDVPSQTLPGASASGPFRSAS